MSPHEHLDHFIFVVKNWMMAQPLVGTLLIMMTVDVFSGIAAAFATQKLSSTVSWRGMSKKVVMLLLVGVAAVLEPFANALPLSKLVAMFYITTEAISVFENAARIGVPLPRALVDALMKLNNAEQATTPTIKVDGKTTVMLVSDKQTTTVTTTPTEPPKG